MLGDVFWENLIYVHTEHFDMRADSEWERKIKWNMTVTHTTPFSLFRLSLHSFQKWTLKHCRPSCFQTKWECTSFYMYSTWVGLAVESKDKVFLR